MLFITGKLWRGTEPQMPVSENPFHNRYRKLDNFWLADIQELISVASRDHVKTGRVLPVLSSSQPTIEGPTGDSLERDSL